MKICRFEFLFFLHESALTTFKSLKGLLPKRFMPKKDIGALLKELPTRCFPNKSCQIPITLFPAFPTQPLPPPPQPRTFRNDPPSTLPTNVVMYYSMNMRSCIISYHPWAKCFWVHDPLVHEVIHRCQSHQHHKAEG